MITFLLSLGSAAASTETSTYAACNVFEIKCLDTEFAFDFTSKLTF